MPTTMAKNAMSNAAILIAFYGSAWAYLAWFNGPGPESGAPAIFN